MVEDAKRELARLLEIMERLRDPETGCPWDREQSFASVVPYTLEEAYEVAEAVANGDLGALRGELGDLLFQVVFHARMAEEAGAFDFADVTRGIADKMVRRHPHVFDGLRIDDTEELHRRWEAAKHAERAGGPDESVLDDVPGVLPALKRAAKLTRRAGGVGFDWPEEGGARAKVSEELAELDAERAHPQRDPARLEHELGDLLLAVVNMARHLKVDPEAALSAANRRFEVRFRYIEAACRRRGLSPRALTLAELDALWNEAKASGR